METLRAILVPKGQSREAADMMSRSLRQSSLQVYKSHWEDSSISLGQNDGKFSMSEVIISVHISCIIQRRIASIDHHVTLHVNGFCAAPLKVRSCSGSAHQAAHQGIQAGTTCTTPNYA